MDTLISLLVKGFLELFPELSGRARSQERENIELSKAKLPTGENIISANYKNAATYVASSATLQPTGIAVKTHSAPSVVEDQSRWHGNLDQNMIINGVIFAELLQPPRAYRPFVRRVK